MCSRVYMIFRGLPVSAGGMDASLPPVLTLERAAIAVVLSDLLTFISFWVAAWVAGFLGLSDSSFGRDPLCSVQVL